MFGKMPRGVSERPKTTAASKAIPSWLWLIVLTLAGLCVVIFLSLWRPWQPVNKPVQGNSPTSVQQDTNTEYKFYDLLPQQKLPPIPDQAVPEHQTKQPIIVVEAPQLATKPVDDPFEEHYAAAKIAVAPRYILQVRSYEDPDSADTRRAEIILNGLSAEIILTNEGNKVWYRVISGPYDSQEAAHIAQQTLQNGGIDSIIIKQS